MMYQKHQRSHTSGTSCTNLQTVPEVQASLRCLAGAQSTAQPCALGFAPAMYQGAHGRPVTGQDNRSWTQPLDVKLCCQCGEWW